MNNDEFYCQIAHTFVQRRQSPGKTKSRLWLEVHDDVREANFNSEDEYTILSLAYEELKTLKPD